MGKTYVVAGAGFRGFCDALQLTKVPDTQVIVIEPAPFFGGVAYSRDVKGFVVDKGVHLFDSIPKDLAAVIEEIMDGQTRHIDFVSESAFGGIVTEGFSLPDLSCLDGDTKARIALELIRLAAAQSTESRSANLAELFDARYGRTAGNIFARVFARVYGIEPSAIEPHGISQTSLGRLKFLDDAEMLVLKAHPWLETVLAARRKSVGKVDDFVSIYPSTGEGMRGWCERAARWLTLKGVRVHLGEKILSLQDTPSGVTVKTDKRTLAADRVIWSNDNVSSLAAALEIEDCTNKLQHGTPMVFATLITRANSIKDFTYLQNFDPEALTYRTAAAGLFGNQIKADGTSFITCECPIRPGSERWERAEHLGPEIWNECKSLGIVKPGAELLDCDIVRIPVTFKLPKVGYSANIEAFRQNVATKNSRVVLRNVVPFFRRDIYLDSLQLPQLLT